LRNALAGILAESFGVTVADVRVFDDQGEVLGRPEQVELDMIVKDGAVGGRQLAVTRQAGAQGVALFRQRGARRKSAGTSAAAWVLLCRADRSAEWSGVMAKSRAACRVSAFRCRSTAGFPFARGDRIGTQARGVLVLAGIEAGASFCPRTLPCAAAGLARGGY